MSAAQAFASLPALQAVVEFRIHGVTPELVRSPERSSATWRRVASALSRPKSWSSCASWAPNSSSASSARAGGTNAAASLVSSPA
jgi:hypothetical protein